MPEDYLQLLEGSADKFIGFGGSPVVYLESLLKNEESGICFFGVDINISRQFGKTNDGAAIFLRKSSARLYPWTKATVEKRNSKSFDIGVFGAEAENIIEQITRLGYLLSSNNYVPVLLGCDHTASYPHVLGVSSHKPLTYLYFDAHLDLGFHNSESTDFIHNGNFVNALLKHQNIEKVINVGARAWSTFDKAYGKQLELSIIRENSAENIIDALKSISGQEIYVSIDADVLDPNILPEVCCPEPFGMSQDSLLEVCSWLSKNCIIRGADFTEFCPGDTNSWKGEVILRYLFELLAKEKEIDRIINFQTENLSCGVHISENFESLHRWQNDEEINLLSAEESATYTEKQTLNRLNRWIANDDETIIHFALYLLKTKEFIGFAHIAMINHKHKNCKIGIVIGEKQYWGKGLGTECLRRLVRYCFEELDMNRVSSETYSNNPRSCAMLKSAGFALEGVLRQNINKENVFVDEHQYAILHADWLKLLETQYDKK